LGTETHPKGVPVQGQIAAQKASFAIFLRTADLGSSYGQMTVCRRPDCDRAAAERALGFCAQDHAVYVRSRERYASLAEAAQVVHANAFAVLPRAERQMLAEYLVAVASEGLAAVRTDFPRSFVLLAAALIARGRVGPRVFDPRASRRPRASRDNCVAVGGRF
jgi:hypothetical protein